MSFRKEYDLFYEKSEKQEINIETVKEQLKNLVIELPSWAVGNSGTRYGTFREAGAARTVWDKIEDCAEIQRVMGISPVMASHVSWDKTEDGSYGPVREYAEERGLRIGTLHPNTFMGQEYKLGSICSPVEEVRSRTIDHFIDCIRIAEEMGTDILGLWLADGTNYPGQDHLRERKHRLFEGLQKLYNELKPHMTLLLEYKPFEPFFYTTDVMDWGMSFLMTTKLGERAKVLVDVGHHLKGVNIEHIISILIDEGKLGGFHLNNKKYADDDLITGTVNPLEIFLIFDQIIEAATEGIAPEITYMLDQSHNIEPSIEGIIQSLMNTQALYAKALLIDRKKLKEARGNNDIVGANRTLMEAFETDVRPLLSVVREEMGREPDPLLAYRQGGYEKKIIESRGDSGINTLGG